MNRKAYFLLLDAVMAIIILVIGFILISMYHYENPVSTQTKLTSSDVLNLMSGTKVRELTDGACTDYYFNVLQQLCTSGNIKNADESLLELVGDLHSRLPPMDSEARSLISEIIAESKINPDMYGIAVFIQGSPVPIYPDAVTYNAFRTGSIKKSKNLISAKKIIFGYYYDNLDFHVWGPYVVEVQVWQKELGT